MEDLAGVNADFRTSIIVVFPLTSSADSSEVTSAEGRVAADGRARNGSTFGFVERCCDSCSMLSIFRCARVMPNDSLLSSFSIATKCCVVARSQMLSSSVKSKALISLGGSSRRSRLIGSLNACSLLHGFCSYILDIYLPIPHRGRTRSPVPRIPCIQQNQPR